MRQPISSHHFPPGLTGPVRERLIANAKIEHYKEGEFIHQRSDRAPGLSIIVDGFVRIGNRGRDGKYQLFAIAAPGNSFGWHTLFSDLPRTHDVEAATPAKIAQLSKTNFHQLANEDRQFERAVLAEAALRYNDLLEMLDDARRLSIPAQVAKTLLMLTAHQTEEKSVLALVTQSDIADMHGLTRVSISNCLKELEKRGLIERGYSEITIPDRPALQRYFDSKSQLAPLT